LVEGDLPAWKELECESGFLELPPHQLDLPLHLLRGRRIVLPHMRSRCHNADPIGDGGLCGRERVLDLGRTVVEPREDVGVQVDHAGSGQCF
jgi:hypothetical protein